jgi:hypothetical protein
MQAMYEGGNDIQRNRVNDAKQLLDRICRRSGTYGVFA